MITTIEGLKRALERPASIVRAGHPVLGRKAAAVDDTFFKTATFEKLVDIMIDTMRREPGVGLAAPQIAVSLRVLVMEDKPEYVARMSPDAARRMGRAPLPLTVLVNPVVTFAQGAETASFREACLSVPGYSAEVDRALACDVQARNRHGEPVSLTLSGWPARIVQHEIDHLDGILYVQRMRPDSFAANGAQDSLVDNAS